MKPTLAVLCLALAFLVASLLLLFCASFLPGRPVHSFRTQLNNDGSRPTRGQISFPSSIDDVKDLAETLKTYRRDHYLFTVSLFCGAYLYKQTFAIPGSVFLNLLSGALFGLWKGFPLVCLLTATGATLCFLLSKVFGKEILGHYFPEKLKAFQEKVADNKDGLFFFLLFLRLFPMSPNWFLNMASPVLGVPMYLFSLSVLIGLMPYNFICCQMGCILSELTSIDDIFSYQIMLKMLVVACISVCPGVCFKLYRKTLVRMKK